jgi:cytochrome c oxidase cbb3-type subunit I/II
VIQLKPLYITRAIGGTLFMTGVIIMIYNLMKTAGQGQLIANEAAEAPAMEVEAVHKGEHWHRWLERRPGQMLIWATILVLIGGIIEILPMISIDSQTPRISSVKPYTPLELQGRDVYIREGCVSCHSQMIRPFRSETVRYGEYSKSGEFIYDRPFLWGSKRTGPDLHRIGGKYSNLWHYSHMLEPTSMSPGSLMPAYPWLLINKLDTSSTVVKVSTLRKIGTPYPPGYEEIANQDLREQAQNIADDLRKTDKKIKDDQLDKREIVALIAYLQRMGTDIKLQQ